MKVRSTPLLFITALIVWGCDSPEPRQAAKELLVNIAEPLPSWNDGDIRSAIISFVEGAVEEGHANFIPEPERIACFDNDGTLWAEQPVYFQFIYARDFIEQNAAHHPEWASNQSIQLLLNGNIAEVAKGGNAALFDIIMASHAGISTAEFDNSVNKWLTTATHPRFKKPYNQLVYRPMLELLDYLRANGFTCFIVSGGGVDFMRTWASNAYSIPSHQIIGSSLKASYSLDSSGVPVLTKLAEINHIDDGPGKPVGVHQYIGIKPAFSVGNSDGDFELLEYTKPSEFGGFAMLIHHTDSIREYAYDRDSHIGRLHRALDEAPKRGWKVVDMAKDWNTVF